MPFKRTVFPYMPEGSFSVLPDGTLYFWPNAPEEGKKRMLEEWPKYVEEVKERHKKFIYDSQDLV